MKFFKILIIVLLPLWSAVCFGQERFSVEFRPGLNFPLEKISGEKLKTGYGFEFSIAYEVLTHVDIYAGWSWNKFSADEVFSTRRADIEETGYTAGIQYIHPIKNSSLAYIIRGGAVYNHLEIEDVEGDPVAESDHGLGWQAEAGFSFTMGGNWSIRPMLRYRTLPGHIDVFNGQMNVDLAYISLGTALVKRF